MSKIVLRDCQERVLEKVRGKFADGLKHLIMVASTGFGKTVCFSYIADCAASLGNTTFIFVHRKELVRQTSRSLSNNGIPHGIIAAGYPLVDQPIQVCSIQTFVRRLHLFNPPDLMVIDECFPVGTLIDGKPIEEYRVGDRILSFDENSKQLIESSIVNTFCNPAPSVLYKIRSGKHSFVCTPEHPVLTHRGWLPASKLVKGDLLVRKHENPELHSMRTSLARLDSIEIHERGSSEQFEQLCPDGKVYNLEVARTHTYLANGFVVHNCHRSISKQYETVMKWANSSYRLGVTATPDRADGKGFTEYYQDFVEADDIRTLIQDGWLVQPTIYAPPLDGLDLSKGKMKNGDFDQEFDALLLDRKVITGSALEHYKKYLPDFPPTVVFCATVQHAHNVAAQFTDNGVPSAAIDGSMDDDQRSEILGRLESGEIRCLMSCNLVSEGFDLPAIRAAIMLRRIGPRCISLFMQMVGRILRPCPGKVDAFLFDHVENCKRHMRAVQSFYHAEHKIDWRPSFEGRQKREKQASTGELVTCPKCYQMFPPEPSCPACGYILKVKGIGGGGLEIEEVDGELVRLDPAVLTFKATSSSGRRKQVIQKLERA